MREQSRCARPPGPAFLGLDVWIDRPHELLHILSAGPPSLLSSATLAYHVAEPSMSLRSTLAPPPEKHTHSILVRKKALAGARK